MDGLELYSELIWRSVPERSIDLAFELLPEAIAAYQEKKAALPAGLYLHRDTRQAESFEDPPGRDWVKIANPLRAAGRWLGVFPNPAYQAVGIQPSGLTSTLAGGLLGAGLGYGGGRVAEWFLPERWKRGRLSRSTAMLGAMLGAAPGAGLSIMQMAGGQAPWSNLGFEDWKGNPQPQVEWPAPPERSINEPTEKPWIFNPEPVKKRAFDSGTGYEDAPPINVDDFGRVIWGDPRVALGLPAPTKAEMTGLIAGSAHLGPDPEWTTAGQIARMATGLGAGYAGGWLAGKALTSLFGMPSEHQEALKRTGAFAGIIGSLAPRVFMR